MKLAILKNYRIKGFFKSTFEVKQKHFKILFLGEVAWKKGLDILLESMPSIIKKIPNVILIIAGPDNEGYKKALKDIINSLDIDSYVKFVGMLDRDEVKKAYVDSDIFLLPSYSENYGITIIESLVCGCPVVISRNVNIHKEIMDNNIGQSLIGSQKTYLTLSSLILIDQMIIKLSTGKILETMLFKHTIGRMQSKSLQIYTRNFG